MYFNDVLLPSSYWNYNGDEINHLSDPGTVNLRLEISYTNSCFTSKHISTGSFEVVPLASMDLKAGFVNDTVCADSLVTLYVANPQLDIKYYLSYYNYGESRTHFSDTLYASTSDTLFFDGLKNDFYSPFNLYSINALGCQKKINGNLYPPIYKINVDFNLSSEGRQTNDTIAVSNISKGDIYHWPSHYYDAVSHSENGDIYKWIFDPLLKVSLSDNTRSVFTSTLPCSFDVKLYGESRFGCKDSIVKTVRFVDEYKKNIVDDVCSFTPLTDNNGISTNDNNFFKLDKEGNLYIVSPTRQKDNEISQVFTISKFSPQGNLLWQYSDLTPSDSRIICSDIEIDDNGNVYFTGGIPYQNNGFSESCLSGYPCPFYPWKRAESSIGFTGKINNEGKIEWVIYSSSGIFNDILYIDDDNIYTSIVNAYYSGKTFFTNRVTDQNINSAVNIYKINNHGELLKQIDNNFNNVYVYGENENGHIQSESGFKLAYHNNQLMAYGYFDIPFLSDSIFNDSSTLTYFRAVITDDEVVAVHHKIFTHRYSEIDKNTYKCIIDSSTYDSYVNFNNVIYKYSDKGELLWQYEIGGKKSTIASLVLYNNEIYAVGTFEDYLLLDGNNTNMGRAISDTNDIYLLRIGNDGTTTGLNTYQSSGYDVLSGMQLTPNNELAIVGTSGKMFFNNKKLSNGGAYLLKLSTDKCFSVQEPIKYNDPDIEWVKTMTRDDNYEEYSIDSRMNYWLHVAVDDDKNVYLFANFIRDVNFGDYFFSKKDHPNDNSILMKYNHEGKLQWSKTLTQSGVGELSYNKGLYICSGTKVMKIDPISTDTISRETSSQLLYDRNLNGTTPVASTEDGCARQYDKDGNLIWTMNMPSFNISAVASDIDQNTYCLKDTYDGVNYYGTSNIVKISNTGKILWYSPSISHDIEALMDQVYVDQSGNVNYIFKFIQSVSVGGTKIITPGAAIAFVKYDPSGKLISANYTDRIADFSSFTSDKYGNMYFLTHSTVLTVTKFSSDGEYMWHKDLPLQYCCDIAVDNKGYYYITSYAKERYVNGENYMLINGVKYPSQCMLMKFRDRSFECNAPSTYKNIFTDHNLKKCIGLPVVASYPSDINCHKQIRDLKYNVDSGKVTISSNKPETVYFDIQDPATGCFTYFDSLNIAINPIIDVAIDTTVSFIDKKCHIAFTLDNVNFTEHSWTPDTLFENSHISNPVTILTAPVTIRASAVDYNGCPTTQSILIQSKDLVQRPKVDQEMSDEDELSVSPIPASTIIDVHVPMGCEMITISDVSGCEVYRNEHVSSHQSISVDWLPSGDYVLSAIGKNKKLVKNIVIQ